MKKSKIYTSTGDNGTTSLVGGTRVKKSHIRIEAYGSVDELNATLGFLAAYPDIDQAHRTFILWIQNKLFDIGAYLATEATSPTPCPGIDDAAIERLERQIDTIDDPLPPLHAFVLPGGTPLAAIAHMARTICRRAERRIIDIADTAPVDPRVLQFINRLSDYLFVLSRQFNISRQQEEITWEKDF